MRDKPLLCKACFGKMTGQHGRAELESASSSPMSVARPAWPGDRLPPSSGLIQAYYRSAALAIDDNGAIIDTFLGDALMARAIARSRSPVVAVA